MVHNHDSCGVSGFDYATVHVLMRITESWRIVFSRGLEEMYVAGRKEFIPSNLLKELWMPRIIWLVLMSAMNPELLQFYFDTSFYI
jgi:hypothetical protein